jgi:hypothetical protein
MRKMQESAKAHAGVRDYHFYVDPDTGDLVNWESCESAEYLSEHARRNAARQELFYDDAELG